MKISELEATGQPVCMGYGVLSVNTNALLRPVLSKRPDAGRQGKGDAENTAGTPQ